MKHSDVILRLRAVTERELLLWVQQGWLRPEGEGEALQFSEADVARASLICELRDHMGIDEEAMPVVLNLMDQVYGLRHEFRRLLAAIQHQPEAVRARITSELKVSVAEVQKE